MADSNFYRAFEDRYRGSRELIKSRLNVYLPFVLPLQHFFDSLKGIDLGCGRGEWLELMNENQIDIIGVDLDQGMLDAAQERGLNVILGDAIQTLRSLESESQTLVSGFHLAEHLPFEVLQVLIQESLRVLMPGGLLILETPNPENITIGTEKFYLDPSHFCPIPSQFLSFMAEYAGFTRVKVLRLQEPAGLAESNDLILLSVLNGVSPDYAVVAQKSGPAQISNATAPAFEAEYGLSLEMLANNYDRQIKTTIQRVDAIAQQGVAMADAKAQQADAKAQQADAKAQQADAKAQQADAKAQQADAKAQQADAKAQQADAKAQQADAKAQQADAKAQQADTRAHQAEVALISIYKSTSWRITSPIRIIGHFVKTAKSQSAEILKLVLAHAHLYINRRARLKMLLSIVFAPFPSLKRRLVKTAMVTNSLKATIQLAEISPRARRIYDELKSAIAKREKGKS